MLATPVEPHKPTPPPTAPRDIEGLLDLLPDPAEAIDANGRLSAVNVAAVAVFGARSGADWRCGWPEEEHAGLDEAIEEARGGKTTRREASRQGQLWDVSFSPLPAGRGPVASVLCVIRDAGPRAALAARLSERERTLASLATQFTAESRRLAAMRAQITRSEKIQLLGEFVAGIVHDINNVLAVVQAAFSLIERRGPGANPAETLELGRQALGRGAQLVRQLLDFARPDTPAATNVSIPAMLDENAAMLGHLLGAGIGLDIVRAETVWPVAVRASALQSVLFNLAANARDAMPVGGTLRIAVANCTDRDIPNDLPAGDYVRLSIADTGRGMPPHVLARAGEPLFTTKPKGAGTGLGLASAFQLAEASGGGVGIDSAVGRGTTVTLFLPRSGARGELAGAPLDIVEPRMHGDATILLMEPDEAVRAVLGDALRGLGYIVIEAPSPEMAIGMSLAGVGLDLLLAALPADGLVEQIRARHANLPVILMNTVPATATDGGEIVLDKPIYEPLLARALLERLGRLPAVTLTARMLEDAQRLRGRIRDRHILELFDRWHGVSRAANRLPSLDEAPEFNRALAPNAYVVEASLGEAAHLFRIVKIGPAFAKLLGRDLSGELVTSDEHDSLGSMALAYRRCATGRAYFDYAKISLGPGKVTHLERLLLPVSQNGETVTHLVGMVTIDNLPGENPAGDKSATAGDAGTHPT